MTFNNEESQDFSIASMVKNRAASGVKRSISKSSSGKSRNYVKPVKPLFEGKSIVEAMPRRNSDSSVSSHHIRKILEDDEVSLSSVQNMETVPSVSESAGILSIISANFRKTRSVTEQHIGELPDRKQLLEKIVNSPIVKTEIQQSSGVYGHLSPESSGNEGNNGSGPKRKNSLGLFHGASLRNLVKQAESNHRRMMALEDSEAETDSEVNEASPGSHLSSPSTSSRKSNPTTRTIAKDVEENGNQNSEQKGTSRRTKRNSSFSGSIKSPELRRAKERMRGTRRPISSATSDRSSSSPKSNQSMQIKNTKSPPPRSRSEGGNGGSAGTHSKSSPLAEESSSKLNDSFAWIPIVQSSPFFDSSTNLGFNDIDSQRGYSSDSSEYLHKSQARWHMSKEGQQIKERMRQQNRTLEETIANKAASHDFEDNLQLTSDEKSSEMSSLHSKWHDTSGIAKSATGAESYYHRSLGVSKVTKNELFHGKTLNEALPAETRKVKEDLNAGNLADSMPSLATITVLTEEGSLSNDAFARHHQAKLSNEKSDIVGDDLDNSPVLKAMDSRRSMLRKYNRSFEALDLEQSNHDSYSCAPLPTYQWKSTSPKVMQYPRDGMLYPPKTLYRDPQRDVSQDIPQQSNLASILDKHIPQKPEHSEASSMLESQFSAKSKDLVKEATILDHLNKKAAAVESKGAYDPKECSDKNKPGDAYVQREAKKKAARMEKAIQRVFEESEVLQDCPQSPLPGKSLGWQRLIQDIHRSPNKKLYPSEDGKQSLQRLEKPTPITNEQEIGGATISEESLITPDFDWNSVVVKDRKGDSAYYKTVGKDSSLATKSHLGIHADNEDWGDDDGKLLPVQRKSKENRGGSKNERSSVTPSSSSKKEKIMNDRDASNNSDVEKMRSSTEDKEETTPFSHRPLEAGPFSTRPSSKHSLSPEIKGTCNTNVIVGTGNGNDDEDDDERSTQSVDRYLVRESSHRRLLRKQVADRRESLQSILNATTQKFPLDEDDVLTLKRKLALSQALVQKLEVEKSEVKRQAVLDVSRAQVVFLEQRNRREVELEDQIKRLMEERNAAVEECHQLRILLSQACDHCKRRFDDDKLYVMDNYVRHTVVTKEPRPHSTAFEWFSGNLARETLDQGNADSELHTKCQDHESVALGCMTPPESGVPSITRTASISWFSDKLFVNQEANSMDRIPGRTNEYASEHVSAPSCYVVHESGNDAPTNVSIPNIVPSSSTENDIRSESSVDTSERSQKSQSKRKGFFASLLGEKVVDEFSSLQLPTESSTARGLVTSKFSLFGNLQAEKVEEDYQVMTVGPNLYTISEGKEAPASKLKDKVGLKSEQVLDDTALINSLASACKEPTSVRDTIPNVTVCSKTTLVDERGSQTKVRSFLRQEIVDVDTHDEQLLNHQHSRSKVSDQGNPRKTSLGAERVDKDECDVHLLSTPRRAKDIKSPTKTLKSDASQLEGSILSSPFTWKRNPSSPRKKRSPVSNYLGKYRSASPSKGGQVVDLYAQNIGAKVVPFPPDSTIQGLCLTTEAIQVSTDSGLSSTQKLPSEDVGERPWRSEVEEVLRCDLDASSPFHKTHGNSDSVIDEIDQVAILKEREDLNWE